MRLEVIEFFDATNRSIVQRVPDQGFADIKYGAQLIVQQNQEAIFFRDGRAMDVFGPGRHTLTTANVPLLTRMLTIPWEKSPFQALVYFVGKQTFIDQKWGTRQPLIMRDSEFGVVRLRGFGKFSFRVADATVLINTLVGTVGKYTTSDVASFLRDLICARLADLLATLQINILDLPAKFDEVAAAARAKVADEFAKYGLELVDFFINSLTPPDEVQKAIDSRSSMGAIGDLREYTMYQAANSMRRMAEQGGGGIAADGMGIGMGMMLPGFLHKAMSQPVETAATAGDEGPQGAKALSAPEVKAITAEITDARALVRGVAKASGWKLEETADVWKVTVAIGPLRKQTVTVQFDRQDSGGHDLISCSSPCGPATEETAMAFLRHNRNMAHAAFAIEATESGEMIVVEANQLADTADPLEITRAITSLAWQADLAEQQLLGTDQY